MCLLIIAWQCHDEYALTLAANRDERYDRASIPFGVLREGRPRTLGGQDLVAGGTWLVVNDGGVVAGLTNTPSPGGPDPSKRSRGAVPLMLTAYPSAKEGVEAFVDQTRPGEYNPARVLVGDREHLYYLDLSGDVPSARELPPGLHVLENAPLEGHSSKSHFVHSLLTGPLASAEDFWQALPGVVASHDAVEPTTEEKVRAKGLSRWPATRAPCVHTEEYGTRSSMMIRVSKDATTRTQILSSGGPPCVAPFHDVTATREP